MTRGVFSCTKETCKPNSVRASLPLGALCTNYESWTNITNATTSNSWYSQCYSLIRTQKRWTIVRRDDDHLSGIRLATNLKPPYLELHQVGFSTHPNWLGSKRRSFSFAQVLGSREAINTTSLFTFHRPSLSLGASCTNYESCTNITNATNSLYSQFIRWFVHKSDEQ